MLALAQSAKTESRTDGDPFFLPNRAANRFLIRLTRPTHHL